MHERGVEGWQASKQEGMRDSRSSILSRTRGLRSAIPRATECGNDGVFSVRDAEQRVNVLTLFNVLTYTFLLSSGPVSTLDITIGENLGGV